VNTSSAFASSWTRISTRQCEYSSANFGGARRANRIPLPPARLGHFEFDVPRECAFQPLRDDPKVAAARSSIAVTSTGIGRNELIAPAFRR